MFIFSKSFLFCKRACECLFKRLSLVFAFGLIRYSYQTGIYVLYGRCERPFLCGLASDPGRQIAYLNA